MKKLEFNDNGILNRIPENAKPDSETAIWQEEIRGCSPLLCGHGFSA